MPYTTWPGAIHAPRMALLPLTTELADAMLASDRVQLARLLQADIPDRWPEDKLLLHALRNDRPAIAIDPDQARWRTRVAVARIQEHYAVAGTCSLLGPPDGVGAIVMYFEIAPEMRQRGYASEAARALMGWAMEQSGVGHMESQVEASNAIGQRILFRLGMVRSGVYHSPATGTCEVHAITRDQWLHGVASKDDTP